MSNHTKPVIPVKIAVIVSIILALVILPAGLYLISQQRSGLETQTKERGRILSLLGAKITGDMIETAISDGVFSPKDIFDTDYVPIPGSDPPQFRTKYDTFLDKLIQGLLLINTVTCQHAILFVTVLQKRRKRKILFADRQNAS